MLFACLLLVALACLVAARASRALGRNAGVALAAPLLLAAGLLIVAWAPGSDAVVEQRVSWLPTIGVDLALRLDGLTLVFALLVLLIGAAVLGYSARYLDRSSGHGSYYVLMTAFAAAMLLLVMADDLVVLFVAWEATTLCSFFLIASSGPAAREPAIRTLLVTAAGGLSLLAAVVVMAVQTGTTQISAVLADPAWVRDDGFTAVVAVLLAVAAFTKSAQLPFQAWLPDSMVAITPVSAYLHAAAMVKAGIYLLLRFSPVLADVPIWTILLVTVGLATALLGAAGALRRYDLKELLAYSTMSQLGLLVAMIGVGTPAALTAAVVHTIAHALFKSALFLLVGVVDHEAGTRDLRRLAELRPRMPATMTAIAVAAASMAGVPLLLGFVSKESMLEAFLHAPGPDAFALVITAAAAVTSVLTFAYSGRLVLGALGGRSGQVVPEASVGLWGVPAVCALSGLALGAAPFVLDDLVTAAAAAVGATEPAHLALWHGLTPALGISAAILATGTGLVLARRRVERLTAPLALPVSGLAVVDHARAGVIRVGTVVAGWAGTTSPRRHLAVPIVGVVVIAAFGVTHTDTLPPVVGDPSRPLDWVLVVLVAAGVVGAIRAATRLAAVVVVGVVGFAMTLWFFVLGAPDVALTQLLVEILTVTVMVLVLGRLPSRFTPERERRRVPAAILAAGAGAATTLGVWALTGRREMSPAADYYVTEGARVTGGANIVNTILVDFRALDTLGELTVLGVAGVVVATLLHVRRPTGVRSADLDTESPLADARENAVFARTATRILGPLVILMSLLLLARGHQEPGGGFIAALVAGAGFALLYLAARSDSAARVRWPYLVLIGGGVVVGAGTGFAGYLDGSFLAPLHADVLGLKLTSALVFDVGVYLAVIGVVLATFNLLGRQRRVPHDDPPDRPDTVGDRSDDLVEADA